MWKTSTMKIKGMKEIKEARWMEDISCSWVNRINIVEMAIVLKLIYRINIIPIKILVLYFTCLEKNYKRIHMAPQRLWILKEILRVRIMLGVFQYSVSYYTIEL